MSSVLEQFKNQQFLNIETFRRSGVGVKTPVWFAQEGNALYIWTQTDSGKAKRIRINPDVKIAPAQADGKPIGKWVPSKAHADESDQALKQVKGLFHKKYGVSFTMFSLMGKIKGKKYTSIRVHVEE